MAAPTNADRQRGGIGQAAGNLRLSVRAPLHGISVAALDGFRTVAEIPLTAEQAEKVAAELLKAARRTTGESP
jgi:hypothetical protein